MDRGCVREGREGRAARVEGLCAVDETEGGHQLVPKREWLDCAGPYF